MATACVASLAVHAPAHALEAQLVAGIRDNVGERGAVDGVHLGANFGAGTVGLEAWGTARVGAAPEPTLPDVLLRLVGRPDYSVAYRDDVGTLGVAADYRFGPVPDVESRRLTGRPHLLGGLEGRVYEVVRKSLDSEESERRLGLAGVVFAIRDFLPTDQLKVALFMAQINASGSTAYDVPWPPVFAAFLAGMRVFLIDAIRLTARSPCRFSRRCVSCWLRSWC